MWCYHTWDVLKLLHTEEITLWDSCWGNVSDFKFRRENPSPKQPVECASTCPQTNELGRCGDESARPMGSAGLKLRGCTRAGVWREAGDRRAQWPNHVLRDKQLPANHVCSVLQVKNRYSWRSNTLAWFFFTEDLAGICFRTTQTRME